MSKDYVSKELARKLQEKGYPLKKVYRQDEAPLFYDLPQDHPDWSQCDAWYLPSIREVLEWLRKRNIYVEVVVDDDSEEPLTYNIHVNNENVFHHHGEYFSLKDWTKCELAGIEYVLDNLI